MNYRSSLQMKFFTSSSEESDSEESDQSFGHASESANNKSLAHS